MSQLLALARVLRDKLFEIDQSIIQTRNHLDLERLWARRRKLKRMFRRAFGIRNQM